MKVLDATAGYRDMWFRKDQSDTVYLDKRKEVHPDVIADFRKLPFQNSVFDLVIFDPPHANVGETGRGIFYKKYGALRSDLVSQTLYRASRELFRVLRDEGILIFKWNTHDRSLHRILTNFPCMPLFGQKTAYKKHHSSSTYWMTFIKGNI